MNLTALLNIRQGAYVLLSTSSSPAFDSEMFQFPLFKTFMHRTNRWLCSCFKVLFNLILTSSYFYPQGSKEPFDSRWRPALQGRGGKSGRGKYSSHSLSSSNGMLTAFCQHKIWR